MASDVAWAIDHKKGRAMADPALNAVESNG